MGRSPLIASRNPTVSEPQHRVIRTCHIKIFIIAVRFRSPGMIPAPDLSRSSLLSTPSFTHLLLSLLGFALPRTYTPGRVEFSLPLRRLSAYAQGRLALRQGSHSVL